MLKKQTINPSFIVATILIVLAAASRLIPHPFNFTCLGAMALFSGANIKDKRFAFLLPIIVLFVTDAIIGFHFSMLPVYSCFTLTVWIGIQIRNKQNTISIVTGSLISSVVFFLVTNLPFWYIDQQLYPITLAGTLQSYTMAIPFFKNQVLGDLFYCLMLFGIYSLFSKKSGILKPIFTSKK